MGRDLVPPEIKRHTWTLAGTIPTPLIPSGGISVPMGQKIQVIRDHNQVMTECSEHSSLVWGAYAPNQAAKKPF